MPFRALGISSKKIETRKKGAAPLGRLPLRPPDRSFLPRCPLRVVPRDRFSLDPLRWCWQRREILYHKNRTIKMGGNGLKPRCFRCGGFGKVESPPGVSQPSLRDCRVCLGQGVTTLKSVCREFFRSVKIEEPKGGRENEQFEH